MPQLLQCVGSFERIQQYANYADCTLPESGRVEYRGIESVSGQMAESSGATKPNSIAHVSVEMRSLSSEPSALEELRSSDIINLSNNSFAWKRSQPPFLQDINLRVRRGSVTVLVGAVGSGKTMLLRSILCETIRTQGPAPIVAVAAVAYCAQQAWLENRTIYDNIIGVSQYDAAWYKTVVGICQLEADLRALDRGDRTLISSKGSNLSGGQMQRIVRAVIDTNPTIS